MVGDIILGDRNDVHLCGDEAEAEAREQRFFNTRTVDSTYWISGQRRSPIGEKALSFLLCCPRVLPFFFSKM
jgi:hypothetical protein